MKMTKIPDNGNLPTYLLQWVTNDKKEMLPRAIHHSSNTFLVQCSTCQTFKVNTGKR